MAQPEVIPIHSLDLDDREIQRLTQSMRRLEAGSTNVLIAPPYDELGPERVFEEWMTILEAHKESLTPTLYDIEMQEASKFGARSIAKDWDARKEQTFAYWTNADNPGRNLDWARDFNWWKGEVQLSHLRPLDVATAAKFVKPSTNAGLPTLDKKREVLSWTLDNLRELWDRDDPAVLSTRTQEQGKTRDVFMVALATILVEQTYLRALLPFRKSLSWRAALNGPEAVERAVTELFAKNKSKGRKLVTVDFSQFDATCRPELISAGFESLMQPFDWTDELEQISHRLQTSGLVTPSGVLQGPHGIPSGSSFTNPLGSQIQYLIANAYFLAHEGEAFTGNVQGDDGLYSVADPDDFLEVFRAYGLQVNDRKSDVSDDEAKYLQLYFSPAYTMPNGVIPGIYSTFRALNRIIHPERWLNLHDEEITGRDYFALRTLSIGENCKRHPLFEIFVRFIASKDSEGLNFTHQGMLEYVRLMQDKKGRGVSNQHGEFDFSGIMNFDIVRMLM